MSSQPIYRFAPSTNGELHLGHAYSALLNLELARKMSGKSLLRLEDIDLQRSSRENELQILRDLEWIGFEWDEEPRRQSEHMDDYKQALDHLEKSGFVFSSQMGRGSLKRLAQEEHAQGGDWPQDPDGSFIHTGRALEAQFEHEQEMGQVQNPSYRFDSFAATEQFDASWCEARLPSQQEIIKLNGCEWGCPKIAELNHPASYLLCSVVDDGLQGVSHVVRGKDLYRITSIQRLLQGALGLEAPKYTHHDLIKRDDGVKLSKSSGDTSLKALHLRGETRESIRQMMLDYFGVNLLLFSISA